MDLADVVSSKGQLYDVDYVDWHSHVLIGKTFVAMPCLLPLVE